jgi:hypothetical protein
MYKYYSLQNKIYILTEGTSSVMAQAVSRRPVIAEAQCGS